MKWKFIGSAKSTDEISLSEITFNELYICAKIEEPTVPLLFSNSISKDFITEKDSYFQVSGNYAISSYGTSLVLTVNTSRIILYGAYHNHNDMSAYVTYNVYYR